MIIHVLWMSAVAPAETIHLPYGPYMRIRVGPMTGDMRTRA